MKEQLKIEGYTIVNNIFSNEEIGRIVNQIEMADSSKATFRKSKDIFAIRKFLKEVPAVKELLFTSAFKSVIQEYLGNDFFVVKSIYFDKPENSNWFVSYHQDLTVSLDKKIETDNYINWTLKEGYYAVQPPIEILNSIYTLRIHLDETNNENGALKIIPGSHLKDIYRPETIDWNIEKEVVCDVQKGGAMFMRPLLLHSSSRTINKSKRRVIHIELSNAELPNGLNWIERDSYK